MPAHVGLPAGPRRRTPGLRREEVAVLAGLSPTWYTYLEQGRDIRPSPEVLESLARVLRLTEDERRYLHLLANGQAPPVQPMEVEGANATMAQLISSVSQLDYPVYSGNVYGDVTAWNEATSVWYTDFGLQPGHCRNMLWWLLTDPQARERIVDWEDDTRDVVARFRAASAARSWDQRFTDLISRMHEASPQFRDWWSHHDVRDQHPRQRTLRVPGLGIRTVQLVVLRMTDSFNSAVFNIPVDDQQTD
jgi:transcriptional regulator with XRE-family HTH domain